MIEARRPILVVPRGNASGTVHGDWLDLDERPGAWSAMHVALAARGHVLGVLTFVSTTPERVYGPADLFLAEEIGRRAALALDNARLYAAAQEAVRARDVMLGFVAHDLRDPLHSMLMHVHRSRQSLDALHRNADWMLRLVKDLLDVSRLDGGALALERTSIAADQILGEVLEARRPAAAQAAIDLQADGERGLPCVWANHDRLLQVLDNLVQNALKFTPRGGRVMLSAKHDDCAVLFAVTDSGIGIAPDDIPHVFDRFWQARTVAGRGAGLGLAIAKSVVEAHGGRIWVDSSPGRGSTFYFTVPVAPPAGVTSYRSR